MKMGLNVKFIGYTVFIVVFISLVFSTVFIFQSRTALLEEFKKTGGALVQNFARNSEIPLLLEDLQALQSLSQNLMQQPEVQMVTVYDQSGKVLVSMDKKRTLFSWQKELIVSPVYFSSPAKKGMPEDMDLFVDGIGTGAGTDIFTSGTVIGNVEVLFSREGIIRSLNRMRLWIFIAATIAAFIGGIAALYFSRTLIMPIQRLARATSSIARGNWEERLDVQRSDEMGQLTESFNIMAASLVAKREQLEGTYRELAQKERMAEIGKFSMIIAHELKNPLGIIKGSVDILSKGATGSETRTTMVGYIQDEVRRLNKLIEDFLSFARPTPPSMDAVDINALVERVVDHCAVAANGSDIRLRVNLGPPASIMLDENQIYQALLNLVTNAVQAIEEKGEVCIETSRRQQHIAIQVRDSGSGIPADIAGNIFDPFFTTKAQGTGLGLAIVKKIVESHGGRITAESGEQGGTVFTLLLPVGESITPAGDKK